MPVSMYLKSISYCIFVYFNYMYLHCLYVCLQNSNLVVHLALLRLQKNGDVNAAIKAISSAIEVK